MMLRYSSMPTIAPQEAQQMALWRYLASLIATSRMQNELCPHFGHDGVIGASSLVAPPLYTHGVGGVNA